MTHDHPNTLPPPFPTTSSYTPRSDYEASTPQTFFAAKEVLYASLGRCSIHIPQSAIQEYEEWKDFLAGDAGQTNGVGEAHTNDSATPEAWTTKHNVSGFVGSGYLTLLPTPSAEEVTDPQAQPITSSSTKTPAGLQIPYPSIHLHAIRVLDAQEDSGKKAAVYLQIEMGPRPGELAEEEDVGASIVEVLLIPDADDTTPSTNGTANGTADTPPNMPRVQEIYIALSACQDLHPDPGEDGDSEDEDGNPRPRGGLAGLLAGLSGGGMPGEGGWITSENAHEFEGEFPDVEVGQTEGGGESDIVALGPGAGTRRERDGEAEDRIQIDGVGEETKWQRTA